MNPNPKPCRECKASGEVRPFYIDRDTCPACKGGGTVTTQRDPEPIVRLAPLRISAVRYPRNPRNTPAAVAGARARYCDLRRRVTARVHLPQVAA
jgi:hypothetical protein